MKPQVLLFDEPTAALDPEITAQVVDIIKELQETGITQVIVTHEVNVAQKWRQKSSIWNKVKSSKWDRLIALKIRKPNNLNTIFLTRNKELTMKNIINCHFIGVIYCCRRTRTHFCNGT